jgi:putative ABC transport system permease protein
MDLYRRLLERLDASPQVRRTALASNLPLSPGLSGSPQVEGWEPRAGETELVVGYQMVSPSYFEVLGLARVEGRLFDDTDDGQGAQVVIVDAEMARRYWPGGRAVGRRLALPGLTPPGQWLQVVGVVESLAVEGVTELPERRLYLPYPQLPTGTLEVVARTAGAPRAAAPALRQTVRGIDPQIPIPRLRDMEAALRESIARPRVNAVLFTVFAAVALLLASLGVYGVMAYSVSQRTREIGVRMALGSDRGRALGLVLRRGMLLTAAGLLLGWGAALLLGRTLESTLAGLTYEVSATDAVTLLGVPVVLAAVAFLACWLPARRATKVDPTEALRYE